MTARRLWQGLPVLALFFFLIGCGGQESDTEATTVTVTEAAPAADTSTASPPKSPEQRAEDTVRAYYNAVDRGSFSKAWGLLSPGLQAELGGFASWRAGYETTTGTEAFGVRAKEASSSAAVVELKIESTDVDECGTTVHQTFAGTWSLTAEGRRFRGAAFDVEKTGGGTPVSDPNSCEYEEEPESYPPSEGSGCDPNYTGCVPESFGDVDCDEVGEEVEVVGEDIYGLDLEGDGYACETY